MIYWLVLTEYSDIAAGITMVAPSSSAHPPQYYAEVSTFNGSLSLNVAHEAATPPAVLNLQVSNNQAISTIALDSKFTGAFDLHTKLAPAKLNYPQISGSTWHVDVDSNSTSWTRGWVGWGTRPKYWNPATDGKVAAVSSLRPIILTVGP
jgi:hypothetical protein